MRERVFLAALAALAARPAAATVTWVLGEEGDCCHDVCDAVGKVCEGYAAAARNLRTHPPRLSS